MCQICSIKQIATQDRWPKPLESAVQEYEITPDPPYTATKDSGILIRKYY